MKTMSGRRRRDRPVSRPARALEAPGERDEGQAARGVGREPGRRLGEREPGDLPPDRRRRSDLEDGRARRLGRPRLPGRPGFRRPDRLPALDRPRRAFEDLPDGRRRRDLDPPAHQPRPERVPRRDRLLGPRPWPRARRPGGRPLRHPGNRRRRQDLEQDPRGRDARRPSRRGGLRRERDLPGHARDVPRLVRDGRRRTRPASSVRPTVGGPGPSPTLRSARESPRPGSSRWRSGMPTSASQSAATTRAWTTRRPTSP